MDRLGKACAPWTDRAMYEEIEAAAAALYAHSRQEEARL